VRALREKAEKKKKATKVLRLFRCKPQITNNSPASFGVAAIFLTCTVLSLAKAARANGELPPTTMPPPMSECPPTYLVVEWT